MSTSYDQLNEDTKNFIQALGGCSKYAHDEYASSNDPRILFILVATLRDSVGAFIDDAQYDFDISNITMALNNITSGK